MATPSFFTYRTDPKEKKMNTRPVDKLGNLVQDTLYHLKSIEHRLTWSKSVDKLPPQMKHKLAASINKVKAAIIDIVMISPNTDVQRMVLDDLACDERMVQYMAITEQLYKLPLEKLEQASLLLDEFVKEEHHEPQEV